MKVQPEVVIPLDGESVNRFAQIFLSGKDVQLLWTYSTHAIERAGVGLAKLLCRESIKSKTQQTILLLRLMIN